MNSLSIQRDIPVLPRRRKSRGVLLILAVAALFTMVLSIGIGSITISPGEVLGILGSRIGIDLPWHFTDSQEHVLLAIRLPRVLLGLLVGASLGISGAAIQGLFRNPLADPGLIGISSGAALAAATTIVLGQEIFNQAGGFLQSYGLPLAAFAGAAATTFLVYRISSYNGKVSVSTMLLAGIALNALGGAGTGALTFVADDAQLRSITFWSLGSLGNASWETVGTLVPFIILPVLGLIFIGQHLNALLLGEAEAGHLGTDVDTVKRVVILLSTLAIGASVAVTGVIGFAGLVTPHLLRLLIGPDNRFLLPGSALLGGILLIVADLAARTLAAPAELPIGIIMATIGAPFFLWLLMKNRGGQSGWGGSF